MRLKAKLDPESLQTKVAWPAAIMVKYLLANNFELVGGK